MRARSAFTVVPVLLGLIAAGVYAGGSGLVNWPFLLPMFASQVAVSILYIIAFTRARAFVRTPAQAGPRATASIPRV